MRALLRTDAGETVLREGSGESGEKRINSTGNSFEALVLPYQTFRKKENPCILD